MQFGGDPAKTVLIGASAGGHLAALYAGKRHRLPAPASLSNSSCNIAGLICLSGVFNIERLAGMPSVKSLIVDPVFGSNVDAWREVRMLHVKALRASNCDSVCFSMRFMPIYEALTHYNYKEQQCCSRALMRLLTSCRIPRLHTQLQQACTTCIVYCSTRNTICIFIM